MTGEATRAVRSTLTDLVAFLDATADSDSPDSPLAVRAASNIRATLATIDKARDSHALREAFKGAWYDTGDKGIFDWTWSAATEEILRDHAERVGQAIDRADRKVRRNPHAT